MTWVCFKWIGRGEAIGKKYSVYPRISSRLPRPYDILMKRFGNCLNVIPSAALRTGLSDQRERRISSQRLQTTGRRRFFTPLRSVQNDMLNYRIITSLQNSVVDASYAFTADIGMPFLRFARADACIGIGAFTNVHSAPLPHRSDRASREVAVALGPGAPQPPALEYGWVYSEIPPFFFP
jgi:hypothetical protein